ncbi:DUF47 domain-containing protein [Mucilaginibacter psychrotolerans]|uniref:DUF47 family protein n=1 Tax=Mucilaginibacter psychrotolerans TaxID=1524096 RepID=A0A4Y8SNB5_9SPHI|nr:DUF47 family protein [Mucilaginibacter psychrotolerans]TFF40141.1 DUF47 family protein [Mucilaginibacter psychrotolerans]
MVSAFRKLFIPKEKIFFDLFNQSCAINVQMAEFLFKMVSSEPGDHHLELSQISRLKQTGNETKHKVYLASAKAFVSPFARSDMYALASCINNICDYIHISSRRFSFFQSEAATPAIKELSGLIIESCKELQAAVAGLSNLNNSDAIKENCNKIKQLEHYADKVSAQAVSAVMSTEKNSVELIKYTEILAALERTTDKCEHATVVIESIIIKNK